MRGASLLEWVSVSGEKMSECVAVGVWRTRVFEEEVFDRESEWFGWLSVSEREQIWVCESECESN